MKIVGSPTLWFLGCVAVFTAVGASGEVAGVPAAGGADAAAYGTEGAKEARTADEIGDRTLADSRGAVGGLSSPSPVGPNVSRGTKGLGLFLAALLALIVGSLLHAAGSLDPQKPEPVLQPGQQPEQTDEDDETVEAGQRRRVCQPTYPNQGATRSPTVHRNNSDGLDLPTPAVGISLECQCSSRTVHCFADA